MRKFINTSSSDINEMYQKDFKKNLFNLFVALYKGFPYSVDKGCSPFYICQYILLV